MNFLSLYQQQGFLVVLFLLMSHFVFKSGIWLLIVPVPVHCFSFTLNGLSKVGVSCHFIIHED